MPLVIMERLNCLGRVRVHMQVGKATDMEEVVVGAEETASGPRTPATEGIHEQKAFAQPLIVWSEA